MSINIWLLRKLKKVKYWFLSENKRLAVIAHEMGHVMGLAHSDFSNVLMRADIAYNSSSTSRAQTNDLGGINYLYK